MIHDRGNVYGMQPFSAELTQTELALTGRVKAGRTIWLLRGLIGEGGRSEIELEIEDLGGTPADSYVLPIGYAFSGTLRPTIENGRLQVDLISGQFAGPDGFGGVTGRLHGRFGSVGCGGSARGRCRSVPSSVELATFAVPPFGRLRGFVSSRDALRLTRQRTSETAQTSCGHEVRSVH